MRRVAANRCLARDAEQGTGLFALRRDGRNALPLPSAAPNTCHAIPGRKMQDCATGSRRGRSAKARDAGRADGSTRGFGGPRLSAPGQVERIRWDEAKRVCLRPALSARCAGRESQRLCRSGARAGPLGAPLPLSKQAPITTTPARAPWRRALDFSPPPVRAGRRLPLPRTASWPAPDPGTNPCGHAASNRRTAAGPT